MDDSEIQPLEKITEELLSQQRQRILALDAIKIVTDVKAEKAYLVPTELSHEQFAEQLKQTGLKDKLVPSYIHLEENRYGPFKITGILTGLSGREINGETRHAYKDLKKAHQIVWGIIKSSAPQLEICVKTDVIETKYAL